MLYKGLLFELIVPISSKPFTQKINTILWRNPTEKPYSKTQKLLNALWWPKWKGNPKNRGYMYTYSWFTLLYTRNQHNIGKQLFCCCCWVAELCLTRHDPMDCSPPGSSVRRISQVSIPEWVAVPSSNKNLKRRVFPFLVQLEGNGETPCRLLC